MFPSFHYICMSSVILKLKFMDFCFVLQLSMSLISSVFLLCCFLYRLFKKMLFLAFLMAFNVNIIVTIYIYIYIYIYGSIFFNSAEFGSEFNLNSLSTYKLVKIMTSLIKYQVHMNFVSNLWEWWELRGGGEELWGLGRDAFCFQLENKINFASVFCK